jgi:hypothetical protein
MPPWYVLLRCRLFGHRVFVERRADPVIPAFWMCSRCGKYGRIV